MKIAIPLFGVEVSPRFGCASRFLVVAQDGDEDAVHTTALVDDAEPVRIPARLASLGVTEVICGGIHRRFLADLRARGIRVTWGVIGPAEEVVQARLADRLTPNQFVAARRCRRRRNRLRSGPGAAASGEIDPSQRRAP